MDKATKYMILELAKVAKGGSIFKHAALVELLRLHDHEQNKKVQ
jgi:hypothetical protein